MIKISNIYTRKGDKGQTKLFGGESISKSSLRVDCYGTIDEATSMLGVSYSLTENEFIKKQINSIQKRLFILGAEVASDEKGIKLLENKIDTKDIENLEMLVDECYKVVGEQKSFIIPGKNQASSSMHVARTIVRRSERKLILLKDKENLREEVLKYVNRLSDAIYALARLEEYNFEKKLLKDKIREIVKDKLQKSGDNNPCFSLENIRLMSLYAEEKAKEINVPIVFSAVDKGGNLVFFSRMYNSLLGSIDISINKAFTANALKMTTDKLANITRPNDELYGLLNTNKNRIVSFGGGYPYIYDGQVCGGIGISGGSVEEDMTIAEYAFAKLKEVNV